nr:hypothetical protein CFP56_50464 [Quercus suber]POE49552.1 hypothetical protein CFP56_50469 [Quercus suber]
MADTHTLSRKLGAGGFEVAYMDTSNLCLPGRDGCWAIGKRLTKFSLIDLAPVDGITARREDIKAEVESCFRWGAQFSSIDLEFSRSHDGKFPRGYAFPVGLERARDDGQEACRGGWEDNDRNQEAVRRVLGKDYAAYGCCGGAYREGEIFLIMRGNELTSAYFLSEEDSSTTPIVYTMRHHREQTRFWS